MKTITYQEVITIDDKDYIVSSCDYSESIADLTTDGVIEDDNQEIINHIIDDIVNSSC